MKPTIPKKHQPRGFQIIYEDQDLIVGSKSAGVLTVAALWNRDDTVHSALNHYVRKGNPKSKKSVYVVHRLDQATTGLLVFAKTESVQNFLKDNWKSTEKIYLTIVHGKLKEKSGIITSHLVEDEDYNVRSAAHATSSKARLAQTQYEVLKENDRFSLIKIYLLTGRKNQIRVHMSEQGTPVVGDAKYGNDMSKYKNLALHSYSLSFTHPFSKKRLTFTVPAPSFFRQLINHPFL